MNIEIGQKWEARQAKHERQIVRIRQVSLNKVQFEWIKGPANHLGQRSRMGRNQFLVDFEPRHGAV